jgi:translocation and assembly module TamA
MRCTLSATLLLLALLPISGISAPVIDAPAALYSLLQQHLGLDDRPLTDEGDQQMAIRAARQQALELLATEGHFSPEISATVDDQKLQLKVVPGLRTHIAGVEITFNGPLEAVRAERLRAGWLLPVGKPFSSGRVGCCQAGATVPASGPRLPRGETA